MKRLNLPTIVGSAALQRVQPISSLCGGMTWRQETGRRRVVMLESGRDGHLARMGAHRPGQLAIA